MKTWFKHPAWIPAAWLASGGNLVAVYFAALPGEPLHATAHAVLAILFAFGARRLSARKEGRTGTERGELSSDQNDLLEQALDQNDLLQQSMDGLQRRLQELEERVDFSERILAKHRESDRLGAAPREP